MQLRRDAALAGGKHLSRDATISLISASCVVAVLLLCLLGLRLYLRRCHILSLSASISQQFIFETGLESHERSSDFTPPETIHEVYELPGIDLGINPRDVWRPSDAEREMENRARNLIKNVFNTEISTTDPATGLKRINSANVAFDTWISTF